MAWKRGCRRLLFVPLSLGVVGSLALRTSTARAGQSATSSGDVTFSKDIAPILQRSCQKCHRPEGVAPMSLITYEDVRPWARAVKTRTGMGPRAGVMPPWYLERNIGIQHFKNDPSLSDDEIAKIAKWADSGTLRGNPADMPPGRVWDDTSKWAIGTPDLIVKTKEIVVKAGAPDWWGETEGAVPTGLAEDRYVTAVEVKEVNDVPPTGSGRATVGGRYVVHHLVWETRVLGAPSAEAGEGTSAWPVHEVGRPLEVLLQSALHLFFLGNDTFTLEQLGDPFATAATRSASARDSIFGVELRGGLGAHVVDDVDVFPFTQNFSNVESWNTSRAAAFLAQSANVAQVMMPSSHDNMGHDVLCLLPRTDNGGSVLLVIQCKNSISKKRNLLAEWQEHFWHFTDKIKKINGVTNPVPAFLEEHKITPVFMLFTTNPIARANLRLDKSHHKLHTITADLTSMRSWQPSTAYAAETALWMRRVCGPRSATHR